jgi:SAM-dependent methyltransferase
MTTSNIDTESQDSWNATYGDAEQPSIWAELPFVPMAVGALASAAKGPVLEIPCGGGRNTRPLAERLPFVIAADRSPGALAAARKAIERERIRNCGLVEADIYSLPFPDASIHGIFCADLLGHLRHPREALCELVRVGHAGSRIVVNFFDADDATRHDDEMVAIGEHEYMYRDVYFRYDSVAKVEALVAVPGAETLSVGRLRWIEGPHEGYRNYEHEHRSVLAVLEVQR